ncbi:unnamed protein product [Ectocarpus sp. 12 AP-2014]
MVSPGGSGANYRRPREESDIARRPGNLTYQLPPHPHPQHQQQQLDDSTRRTGADASHSNHTSLGSVSSRLGRFVRRRSHMVHGRWGSAQRVLSEAHFKNQFGRREGRAKLCEQTCTLDSRKA